MKKSLSSSFLLSILLLGCATISQVGSVQQLDPEIYYRHDLRVIINKHKINGVGVVPLSNDGKYQIEVKSPGKMDLLRISTCSGEFAFERVGHEHDFKINLSDDFEGRGSCLLRLEAYEQSHKQRHSWGLVDFKTNEEQLPAVIYCNGVKLQAKGVTICESKEKLWQRIVFPVEVSLPTIQPRCSLGTVKGSIFEFRMPNRECVYRFKEVGGEGRIFRLTLIGYENILVRSEVKSNWDRDNDVWDFGVY